MGVNRPIVLLSVRSRCRYCLCQDSRALLPLDDYLYALLQTLPQLSRSSLHRCLQRHGISRLPEIQGDKPAKQKFKTYPIGYVHIDIAEVRRKEGKLHLFVAIDRTSKFVFVHVCTGVAIPG